jgi:hypothetical protein
VRDLQGYAEGSTHLSETRHGEFEFGGGTSILIILYTRMCVGVRVYCRRTSTPFFFFFFLNQAVSPQKEKAMCRKVKCTNCQKWTWAGCGQHIESCLAGVPVSFLRSLFLLSLIWPLSLFLARSKMLMFSSREKNLTVW